MRLKKIPVIKPIITKAILNGKPIFAFTDSLEGSPYTLPGECFAKRSSSSSEICIEEGFRTGAGGSWGELELEVAGESFKIIESTNQK
jgi:hypothetical protein